MPWLCEDWSAVENCFSAYFYESSECERRTTTFFCTYWASIFFFSSKTSLQASLSSSSELEYSERSFFVKFGPSYKRVSVCCISNLIRRWLSSRDFSFLGTRSVSLLSIIGSEAILIWGVGSFYINGNSWLLKELLDTEPGLCSFGFLKFYLSNNWMGVSGLATLEHSSTRELRLCVMSEVAFCDSDVANVISIIFLGA